MSKIQRMRESLLALREEHERDGALPTSVRFLFYELVQRGQIPKKAKGRIDRLVSEALMDLRESGQVAWDDIIDETRDLEDYTGHCDLKAATTFYIERAVELDPRRGNAPLIITESRIVMARAHGFTKWRRIRISHIDISVADVLSLRRNK